MAINELHNALYNTKATMQHVIAYTQWHPQWQRQLYNIEQQYGMKQHILWHPQWQWQLYNMEQLYNMKHDNIEWQQLRH